MDRNINISGEDGLKVFLENRSKELQHLLTKSESDAEMCTSSWREDDSRHPLLDVFHDIDEDKTLLELTNFN